MLHKAGGSAARPAAQPRTLRSSFAAVLPAEMIRPSLVEASEGFPPFPVQGASAQGEKGTDYFQSPDALAWHWPRGPSGGLLKDRHFQKQ